MIIQSTGASVAARSIVKDKSTVSGYGVANIVGTHVSVVAIRGISGNTNSGGADISDGTGILIAARKIIIDVHAFTGSRITGIVGTEISVAAILGRTRNTNTSEAVVTQGTGITIGTRSHVICVHASSRENIASIVGTQIIILALRLCSSGAATVLADISDGAGISIATRSSVVRVHAFAGLGIARIIGTSITIVATPQISRNTNSAGASIA